MAYVIRAQMYTQALAAVVYRGNQNLQVFILDRHLARRKLKGQLAGHAQDTVTVVAARVIC